MELKTIKYEYEEIQKEKEKLMEFKKFISISNIIYFFHKDNTCLYIGETRTSLMERCYKHTPKESEKPWFVEANTIHIIKLDKNIDDIARQALESSFILAYRTKFNKKG